MKNNFNLSLKELKTGIHAALRAWRMIGGSPENLLDSLLLVQKQRAKTPVQNNPSLLRLATNQVILNAIEELKTHDQTGAQVLRLRFLDDKTIVAVANQLNVSEHTVSRLQRQAIERLSEILFSHEAQIRKRHAQTLEAHLSPPSYTRLFGVDGICAELAAQLAQPGTPWVIAVIGIGGIGKTALADMVTRQIIQQFRFDRIIWLRITPQTMSGKDDLTQEKLIVDLFERLWPEADDSFSPQYRREQVRQALKARPYLIIIDNLESETDTAYLIAHLNDLAQPSKFLLTTRTHPLTQAPVFTCSVDELSPDDAYTLIRHHAQDIGVTSLATAAENDFEAIYDITGGNPLALKLVVSLLDILPLSRILQGLTMGQPGPIEDLFRHIYWQAWQVLSQDARALLQSMPLAAESGALPDYLQATSGLSETQLWPAIQELQHRSLLEIRGTIREKRYGIHRLTETFLTTEIIHWPQ